MASSSLKPPPTAASAKANRLPAPSLFVGPPSRNASALSLARTPTHESTSKPVRDPLNRHKSALSRPYGASADQTQSNDDAAKDQEQSSPIPPLKKVSERGIEARWKEMQSTLNEVELTAQSSTHVFGEAHSAALDELRIAQIELARAWARGHEDNRQNLGAPDLEANVNRFKGADDSALDRKQLSRRRGDTVSSASTALSDESGRSGDFLSQSSRSNLEDETAQDIKLASERRAANEAYFKKVDGSVRDVVAKLEVVAETMRGVEGESRSLWSGTDSTEISGEDVSPDQGNETTGG